MRSAADELAHYLEDRGIGLFGGNADWSIHIDREPFAPDRVVTLYDTGGSANVSIDPEIRNPTFQVRVRGLTFSEAYEMQELISQILTQPGSDHASFERVIGGHVYLLISIHIDREPFAPDRVVTLYDTGGSANVSIDPEIRNPTFQVRVRGLTFSEAYEMQELISQILTQPGSDHASFERVIGGHVYLLI